MRSLCALWFQPWGVEDAPTSWSFGQILPTGLSKSFIESDLYAFPDMQLIYLELPGDFNQDAILNAPDIDRLSTSIRTGQHELRFDLNENGLIEPKDRDTWVHNLAQTHYGDADVDGTFDSSDLVSVMVAGQYEDDLALNSTWSTGDWNGDGEFDSSDLVLAFEDGGYAKAATAVKAVPEPRSFAVFAIVIPLLVRRFRL